MPKSVATVHLRVLERRRSKETPWNTSDWACPDGRAAQWLNLLATMYPPQFSKLGVQLSLELVADLGSQLALRKPTIRRPISVSTGIKRTVNGSKEIAKCVAEMSRKQVA